VDVKPKAMVARFPAVFGFVVLLAVVVAAPTQADTYDFVSLSPANNATISYADWYNAGSYVRFTIRPDPNHPCSDPKNIYSLDVNGVRVGRFSQNDCSTSVYLRTPGRYSWRTVLYIYDQGLRIDKGAVHPRLPRRC
jgi:hypothetical protein